MNDKIVLDFGRITSEMEEQAVKLIFVKDRSWFVIDDNNNLFSIEDYRHNTYLDKLIGEGCVVAFEKSNADLSKISGFDKEIWDIDKVQQFIENVVKIEYPNVKETISVNHDQLPACRFNLGDKVKIPYICDGDRHNGEVGEVIWIHPYKFYPGGDTNNYVWKYQMGITYPDGQSIMVDPDRKPSGIVSEVILVKPKSPHLSLDNQIQSASDRAAESHSTSKVPEPEKGDGQDISMRSDASCDATFTIINGIQVDLRDYTDNEELISQLIKDESFMSDVSFGFEKEFSWADDEVSGDEILEIVVSREIEKRIDKSKPSLANQIESASVRAAESCPVADVNEEKPNPGPER